MSSIRDSGAARRTVHISQDRLRLDSDVPLRPYLKPSSLGDELSKRHLQHWLKGNTNLSSVRACGRYNLFCGSARCAKCSGRLLKAHRQELYAALNESPAAYAILWTATVPSAPGRALEATWNDLDRLIRHMNSGGWLLRRVNGYARAVEVELAAGGWHPHSHTLLVFRNGLTRPEAVAMALAIRARWLKAGDIEGIAPDKAGQHFCCVPLRRLGDVIGYLTKDALSGKPVGKVTGARLLRAAAAGDPSAVRLWREYQHAASYRRTWQTGGTLKPSSYRRSGQSSIGPEALRT